MSDNQPFEPKQSRLKLGSVAIATTLLYLGLAVLGSGGIRHFFRHPSRIVLTVASLAMASTAFFSEANLSSGEREDRSNRWIFVPLLVIGFLSAYLPAYTERKGRWILDGNPVCWLGVFLYGAGGALRIWPVFVLGRRFSGLVAIQRDHELVTDGIYGIIRHPSYLGAVILMFGWALAFPFGSRANPGRPHHPADPRPHPIRRGPPTRAIWRAIRLLLSAHFAAHPRHLLTNFAGAEVLGGDAADGAFLAEAFGGADAVYS
jgi:protein-S-isoprenylcysteine O-methyltransferase Ste14